MTAYLPTKEKQIIKIMAKSNGNTRSSSSAAPRGINRSTSTPAQSASNRLEQQEEIADRFYRNGELTVDPGDAVYTAARSLAAYQISESIENLTDYDILPEVARGGDTIAISVFPRNYDTDDLISQFGEDSFRIRLESQSLMDIVTELRSSSISTLFKKYR